MTELKVKEYRVTDGRDEHGNSTIRVEWRSKPDICHSALYHYLQHALFTEGFLKELGYTKVD